MVGFISDNGVVTVHKKSCPEANDFAAKHGDRIILLHWDANDSGSFIVQVSIKGLDRIGIINDITRYISLVMSVNIRRINIETEAGVFEGSIDLYVHNRNDLEKLIRKLQKIEGIQSVVRNYL